jgi:3-dehydroquinate dehydratase-2
MFMSEVLVLHGPNLHYLGKRETNLYGSLTLDEINQRILDKAKSLRLDAYIDQSNSEAELMTLIYEAKARDVNFIIFNPAAYTHTSIALRDALIAVEIPFIEVHLSNIYTRESFRHHSYFSDIALGSIAGLGPNSYLLALEAAATYLKDRINEKNSN